MDEKLVSVLNNGGIAVIPTDTIYGIVGSALNPQTVKRIYKLRKRSKKKPFIILISSLNDLNQFNIELTKKQIDFLKNIWPNPVSIILPSGKKSLAFRMPKNEKLLQLLKKVGPLVAPSANFEGEKPAEDIGEVKKYFGNNVLCYIDKGKIISKPSTLIKLNNDGSTKILRQGEFKL